MNEHLADKMSVAVGSKGTVLVFKQNGKWEIKATRTPAAFVCQSDRWSIVEDPTRTE